MYLLFSSFEPKLVKDIKDRFSRIFCKTYIVLFFYFLQTKGALTDYILIYKKVETVGVYDNENITAATNKCEKEFKEREEIKIEAVKSS